MSILLLFLSWYFLYIVIRFIFDGKPDKGAASRESGPEPPSQDCSGYLNDAPDALRPDIEAEDFFDPTDFM